MCIPDTSNEISKLHIKIQHEIYKYATNAKLLFKNYVKLTLQCLSGCSDVKEYLRLARKLKRVAQLSQRDRTAGWVSYGQKGKTEKGRQYFTDIIGLQGGPKMAQFLVHLNCIKF